MLNEEQLLQDISDAENVIKETLENLSKKYPSYGFCMASTEDEYSKFGLDNNVRYMVDISCSLKKVNPC